MDEFDVNSTATIHLLKWHSIDLVFLLFFFFYSLVHNILGPSLLSTDKDKIILPFIILKFLTFIQSIYYN